MRVAWRETTATFAPLPLSVSPSGKASPSDAENRSVR
jgi:hypothetical protein